MSPQSQKKGWFDLGILILSLILALLVWGYVDNRRVEVKEIKVPLELTIPSGWEMGNTPPENVKFTIQGPREQMKSVSYGDLKILKRITDRDVSSASGGAGTDGTQVNLVSIPLAVKDTDLRLPPGVVVVSIEQESLTANLERLVQQYVRVTPTFEGAPPEGYRVQGVYADPNTVQVTVPEGVLNFGDTLECYPIDISNQTKDIYRPVGVKSKTLPNGRVIRTNARIDVSVIIEPVPQTRTIEKIPVYILYGLALRTVKIEPAAVTVEIEGPKAVVDALKETDVLVYVDMRDITGDPRGDHNLRARVQLPPDVAAKAITPTEVTVSVR